MRTLIFFLIATSLILASCKKENHSFEDQQLLLNQLTDSCSYTIDGKIYTCDQISRTVTGNAQVYPDTVSGIGYSDSTLFYKTFGISNSKGDGQMAISFAKKYGNNQLANTYISIKRPEDELELYSVGKHAYAVDFLRFNTQNGVAIEVLHKFEKLITYSDAARSQETVIGLDSQNNSIFQIINLHKLPNGVYIVEAKFSANVYTAWNFGIESERKQKRLENGYIRFQIR